MHNELKQQLNSLAFDDSYVVLRVLKTSDSETTQVVERTSEEGVARGPYIRKYISTSSGLGNMYKRIYHAQASGQQFKHIPKVIDCYDIPQMHVVVLEYLKGKTLADVVYDQEPSIHLAQMYFPSVCDAVQELHVGFEPPVIHRDLKPSNIMIVDDCAFIIDFGISRSFNEDALSDTKHFGTHAYAPPEQFGFGQTDVRSDVYTLGMVLYYMLTEATPSPMLATNGFQGSHLPKGLLPILCKACAFDPAHRYQSVAELKVAFTRALESEPYNMAAPQEFNYSKSNKSRAAEPQNTSTEDAGKQPFVKLGHAWNILLLLTAIGLTIICVCLTFAPDLSTSTGRMPFWARGTSYAGAALMLEAPMLVLCDPRPLSRIVPSFAKLKFLKRAALVGALELIGVLLIVVAAAFYPYV